MFPSSYVPVWIKNLVIVFEAKQSGHDASGCGVRGVNKDFGAGLHEGEVASDRFKGFVAAVLLASYEAATNVVIEGD
jgi:hypothetical protein